MTVEVFIELLVLLAVARGFGEIAERLRLMPSVGELLAGLLIAMLALTAGPKIAFFATLPTSRVLEIAAELGIFFIMLRAGIEMEPGEFRRHPGLAFAAAVGGVVVPLGAGMTLGLLFLPDTADKPALALLTGTVLAITSVPAAVKVFEELDLLHSRAGEVVVAAAIFDDVIGLILLAILLALIQQGEIPEAAALGLLFFKVVAFFAITIAIGTHVYPHVRRGIRLMQAAAFEFSVLLGTAFAYAVLAELLGIHWILGAFMAGLFFERPRVGGRVYDEIDLIVATLTGGILGPLFFASIGARVNLATFVEMPLLVIALVLTAAFGKLFGAGLPALASGLRVQEAVVIGAGMSARGAVELVILSIAHHAGLFDSSDPTVANLFSALVIMVVVTTMITPLVVQSLAPTLRGPRSRD